MTDLRLTELGWSPEIVGLDAMAFLAAHPAYLREFLRNAGIEDSDLYAAAHRGGFHSRVLDFILSDPQMTAIFAEHAGIPVHAVTPVRDALAACKF